MADPSSSSPASFPGEISGIGRRLLALLIDWFASMGIVLLIGGSGALASSNGSLAVLGVFVVEVVILVWLIGGSFGQRLMGLQVISISGQRLGLWRILIRTLLICLVLPPLVMDSYGRGLQDRAVGSVVIRRGAG